MKEINRLVDIGVMKRQSSSQWASPTFLIPKKDMTVRTITDFRELKSFWATQAYTIPFTLWLWPFSRWIIRNNQSWSVWLMLLKRVLAWWWHLVIFRTAMNLLHWAMHMLSYRCTVTAIKTASKLGTFVIVVLFAVSLVAAGAIRSE
jgi:hypothetical protein